MSLWLRLSIALSVGVTAPILTPTIAAPARTGAPQAAADNLEMATMFDADQGDRDGLGKMGVNAVATRDAKRRTRTKSLLDAGKLRSANDFYHAAMIFQHGLTATDYLLAHTLATIAAVRGSRDAVWLSAASLDRYLQTIGQKQIFGTQFQTFKGSPLTQEPYDRTLISDSLRNALGVPSLVDQDKRRQKLQKEMDVLNSSAPAAPER